MHIDCEKFAVMLVRKSITAKKVAEKAGISNTSIYNIKKGLRCSDEMGHKIAAALGVEVSEIMENKITVDE